MSIDDTVDRATVQNIQNGMGPAINKGTACEVICLRDFHPSLGYFAVDDARTPLRWRVDFRTLACSLFRMLSRGWGERNLDKSHSIISMSACVQFFTLSLSLSPLTSLSISWGTYRLCIADHPAWTNPNAWHPALQPSENEVLPIPMGTNGLKPDGYGMLWVNTVNTHPVEPQISCEMVHTEYCHIRG